MYKKCTYSVSGRVLTCQKHETRLIHFFPVAWGLDTMGCDPLQGKRYICRGPDLIGSGHELLDALSRLTG